MEKIIAALTAALAFVFGSRSQVTQLKQQITDRDAIITDLRAAVDADNADDASLEAAATAAAAAQKTAEDKYNALLADIDGANAKADELAASITNDPEVPVKVDPGTGAVTPSE